MSATDSTGGPIASAEDVVVRFPLGRQTLTAVDGVTVDVMEHEFVGLVGESGSGKSTLGRTLVRAQEPTEGRITYRGQDITHLSHRQMRPIRRRMQMIFQDPFASLDPRMRVDRLVSEPLRVHRVLPKSEIQGRVIDLLERVGLPASAAQRYPGQFSGGQRQRISIARAIALEPEFLVADEPVSALDVSIQAQIMQLLMDLRASLGLSALVIAHDLALVQQVTDRVAVLYLGQVVEEGPTDDVVFGPAHPYTASLVAATPLTNPTLERARDRIVLKGEQPSPISPPEGCRFHPRCPIAIDRCRTEAPPLVEIAPRRKVACHLPFEVPSPLAGIADRV